MKKLWIVLVFLCMGCGMDQGVYRSYIISQREAATAEDAKQPTENPRFMNDY
ncbi:MAG TPA: hypothetical protein P5048_04815 [Chlamydiales bacterium]|nr:hypothetical protein [Chlamydiales bacterium]